MKWNIERNQSKWRLKGIIKNLQSVANNPSLTKTEKSHIKSAMDHIEQVILYWSDSHTTSKVEWNKCVEGNNKVPVLLSPAEMVTYAEDMYNFFRRPSNVNPLNEQ